MRSCAAESGCSMNLACFCQVNAVDYLFRLEEAVEGPAGLRHERAAPPLKIDEGRRRTNHSRRLKQAVFIEVQYAEFRLADAGRIFQHRLEHRLQIAR